MGVWQTILPKRFVILPPPPSRSEPWFPECVFGVFSNPFNPNINHIRNVQSTPPQEGRRRRQEAIAGGVPTTSGLTGPTTSGCIGALRAGHPAALQGRRAKAPPQQVETSTRPRRWTKKGAPGPGHPTAEPPKPLTALLNGTTVKLTENNKPGKMDYAKEVKNQTVHWTLNKVINEKKTADFMKLSVMDQQPAGLPTIKPPHLTTAYKIGYVYLFFSQSTTLRVAFSVQRSNVFSASLALYLLPKPLQFHFVYKCSHALAKGNNNDTAPLWSLCFTMANGSMDGDSPVPSAPFSQSFVDAPFLCFSGEKNAIKFASSRVCLVTMFSGSGMNSTWERVFHSDSPP